MYGVGAHPDAFPDMRPPAQTEIEREEIRVGGNAVRGNLSISLAD